MLARFKRIEKGETVLRWQCVECGADYDDKYCYDCDPRPERCIKCGGCRFEQIDVPAEAKQIVKRPYRKKWE